MRTSRDVCGGHMSKWRKQRKIGALITGTVLGAGALGVAGGGAAAASGPPIYPVATKTVLTLPTGCTDPHPTVKLIQIPRSVPAPGANEYRGFMNAQCGSTNKIFYLQVSTGDSWTLRTTPYTTFDAI